MSKLKDRWEEYKAPTPSKWRKLGDALLATSMFITTYAVYEHIEWLAYVSIALGGAGKFLTEFHK